MDIFLVLEGLQQPAQAIADRRLLRHRTVLEQLAIARLVMAQDNVQLVHLAAGALDQVDVAGVQRVKFTKHHADFNLFTRELQPEKTVQRLELLRARAFDLVVQQLAEIAFGHAAGIRHLLQSTALLLNGRLQVIKLRHGYLRLVC